MKKFLGLLGSFMIASSLMLPSIDASPYRTEVEETKLQSTEGDPLQTKNLVYLNRNKRDDMNRDCEKTGSDIAAETQVLTGAAVGAGLGSVVPGIGIVVGGMIGSLLGNTSAAASGCPEKNTLTS